MERLTDKKSRNPIPDAQGGLCVTAKFVDRLADYEDTMPLERAQELAKAEKDGRLIALPCKVGDTVYRVLTTRDMVATPQEARSVLPNSLKTEVIMTADLREWRHILRLRTDKAAHPQMREVMVPLLKEFKERVPVVFDDIEVEE